MPLPQLLSAQVVKTVRRRRLIRVRHRVVFGTLAAVQQGLAACGWQIKTAFVERLNLSLRQHVAAAGRRVATLCKGEDGCVPPFTHSALKRAVLLMMPAVRRRLHMDPHGSNMHLSSTKSAG